MSCYLPLVQRWRKPKKETKVVSPIPDPSPKPKQFTDNAHVHALRDRKGVTLSQGVGDFPHEVFLNIRHDHPTLGLDDVAYQRIHLEHTHQTRDERTDPGVVSLGLPLGISSLKLSSKVRKVKNRRTNGHVSDGDLEIRRGTRCVPEPAVRRGSLPRKAKIPSAYTQYHSSSRPLSIDADVLLGRCNKSSSLHEYLPQDQTPNKGSQGGFRGSTGGVHWGSKLALLTSPSQFMGTEGEKSSSGNSSGSDLTWDGTPPPDYVHPALRGRGLVEVGVARGPPPKHLLPKRLKPSPMQKMHPSVVLTPEIKKELERYQEAEDDITTDDDELTPSLPINPSHVQYKKPSRASRMSRGSPFGGSRHTTPRGSEKIRKNITPSPLDSGYKTMEHSYDGDSSVSSDSQNFKPADGQTITSADFQTKSSAEMRELQLRTPLSKDMSRISRLCPGVNLRPRRGESVPPCYLNLLSDRQLVHLLSYLNSQDLVRVSSTCTRLYKLAWNIHLWKTISLEEDVDVDKAVRSILVKLVWGSGGPWSQGGPWSPQDRSQGGPWSQQDRSLLGAPCVETVLLGGCRQLTDRSLALLARNCPQLVHLDLQRCRNVTNGGLVDLLNRCSRLEHLDITGCPMVSTLNPGRRVLLSLSYLDLSECVSLDDTGLQMIGTSCPNLTHLYLRKCINITDTGVRSIATYIPQLRELSLSDCSGIGDAGIAELSRLGPSLRYLSICRIGPSMQYSDKSTDCQDAGLRLVLKHCYKLRYLNCRGGTIISDSTLQYIAAVCTKLRSLDVGKCSISDTGLRYLSSKLPNLRKLSLRGCEDVGDGGVAAVARGCKSLIHLNIQECDISSNLVRSMLNNMNHCFIEYSPFIEE